MAPEDPTIDSSSIASPTDTLASLTKEQRAEWRLTGKLPTEGDPAPTQGKSSEPKELLTDSDSSPTAPADPAAETSAQKPSDSEPDTPAPSKPARVRSGAEERIKELLSDREGLRDRQIEDLRRQYDDLRRSVPTPSAAPSPAPIHLQATIEQPDISRPMLTENEFYQAFPDATIQDMTRYVTRYEHFALNQAQQIQVGKQQRYQSYQTRVQDALQVTPEVGQKLDQRMMARLVPVDNLPPGTPINGLNVIGQEILVAERPVALLEYFTDHPEALEDLARRTQAEIVRQLGRLDALFEKAAEPSANGSPKRASSAAPAPPATLGRRHLTPADDAQAAVAAGDFRRFKALEDRKELSKTSR